MRLKYFIDSHGNMSSRNDDRLAFLAAYEQAKKVNPFVSLKVDEENQEIFF